MQWKLSQSSSGGPPCQFRTLAIFFCRPTCAMEAVSILFWQAHPSIPHLGHISLQAHPCSESYLNPVLVGQLVNFTSRPYCSAGTPLCTHFLCRHTPRHISHSQAGPFTYMTYFYITLPGPPQGGRVHGEIIRLGCPCVSENVTTWA